MLAAIQNDLFGLIDLSIAPRILEWKNCACPGCKMDNCNSLYGEYEIMLSEIDSLIELVIWSHKRKDGFGFMVLEETFKGQDAARAYAEKWVETKLINMNDSESPIGKRLA